METERPLIWIASSRKSYRTFPREALQEFGHALHQVQLGVRSLPGAKPLSSGVLKGLRIFELTGDFDGDTYRVVYTTKLEGAIYVLHAFKKKSVRGIATPQHEIELIRMRFETAVRVHQREFGQGTGNQGRTR
ncbi:type II toxin-antitoxin system RelE/ParE family toxin [Longimicrobium sp.]|uniref:type II toxin-antitoxin system RelE/ParE family toxin n=1 Tax=Longimicrobium sp. TaxID=2029185 RepID=UPI002C10801B|nr:type II toxin-antitoxin system RelE/ParE family toxin [Longimicrobium sp.]HSU16012.1 type II toxin-antitoxin system RelE/ParE family toxin [Longimicrobium sp.]